MTMPLRWERYEPKIIECVNIHETTMKANSEYFILGQRNLSYSTADQESGLCVEDEKRTS